MRLISDRFIRYNGNRDGKNVGDCTVRAISTALGQDWDTTYWGLCIEGYIQADMPSSNQVWGRYLKKYGFRRHSPSDDVTVLEFAETHSRGTYLLALDRHVVAVVEGEIIDTWNSGDETVLYFWAKN